MERGNQKTTLSACPLANVCSHAPVHLRGPVLNATISGRCNGFNHGIPNTVTSRLRQVKAWDCPLLPRAASPLPPHAPPPSPPSHCVQDRGLTGEGGSLRSGAGLSMDRQGSTHGARCQCWSEGSAQASPPPLPTHTSLPPLTAISLVPTAGRQRLQPKVWSDCPVVCRFLLHPTTRIISQAFFKTLSFKTCVRNNAGPFRALNLNAGQREVNATVPMGWRGGGGGLKCCPRLGAALV